MTLDQPQCVITPKLSYWMQWSQFHGRLHSSGQWDRVMSKATLESYPSIHTLLLQMMRTYYPACGSGYWVFVKRFWTVGKAAFLMLNNALWPMPRSWRMQKRTSAMSAIDPLKTRKKRKSALRWIGDALLAEPRWSRQKGRCWRYLTTTTSQESTEVRTRDIPTRC